MPTGSQILLILLIAAVDCQPTSPQRSFVRNEVLPNPVGVVTTLYHDSNGQKTPKEGYIYSFNPERLNIPGWTNFDDVLKDPHFKRRSSFNLQVRRRIQNGKENGGQSRGDFEGPNTFPLNNEVTKPKEATEKVASVVLINLNGDKDTGKIINGKLVLPPGVQVEVLVKPVYPKMSPHKDDNNEKKSGYVDNYNSDREPLDVTAPIKEKGVSENQNEEDKNQKTIYVVIQKETM